MKGIVIGAAPSLIRNMHMLDIIRKIVNTNEDVFVFSTDHMLKAVVYHGIDPRKIICTTTEAVTPIQADSKPYIEDVFKSYYAIPQTKAQLIRVVLSCQVHDDFIRYLIDKGFRLLDFFHRGHMQCIRKIRDDALTFYDGFNVGVASILTAYNYFGIKQVYTVGIDLAPNRQGELQNSMVALTYIDDINFKIINCNPGHIGKFYSPISESRLYREFDY